MRPTGSEGYRLPGTAVDSVTLMFSDASRWNDHALTSQDAGRSWLAPELVVAPQAGGIDFWKIVLGVIGISLIREAGRIRKP